MKIALVTAIALCAVAAPARAGVVTLPVNRFIVDLPAGWHVQRAIGASNGDVVRSDTGGDLAIGWITGSCDAMLGQQVSRIGATPTLAPAQPAYVPAGWDVHSFQRGAQSSFVACHAAGDRTLVVQWWDELDVSWQAEMTAMLDALTDLRRAGVAAARDDLVTMPGTQLATQLPDALRVASSDPAARLDVLDLDRGDTVEIHAADAPCADLVGGLAPGATGDGELLPSGWRRWQAGARDAFCVQSGTTYVVVAPHDDAATAQLLDAFAGELAPARTHAEAHLPGSRWKLALPAGWVASDAGGGVTSVSTGDATITIRRAPHGCATVLAPVDGRSAYDPSWLPDGWDAVIDASSTSVTWCTAIEQGVIEVELPTSLLEGRARHTTANALVSLRAASARPDPVPLLPIELAAQTTSTDGRGYGGRIGVELWLLRGIVVARGSLGWDSRAGVRSDVHGTLGLPLGDDLIAYGAVGRDQIGSGAASALGGAFYLGAGLRAGTWNHGAHLYAEVEHLWRGGPTDDARYPDHEWRVRSEVLLPHGKWFLDGAAAEYVQAGGIGVWTLGLFTHL